MMSKRCHLFPRLIINKAEVLTTDTIYRGNILPKYQGQELNLVASFHNSLTLLTAEIEGRSFGGGVLELVPSEIARLLIPFPVSMQESFEELDKISRNITNKQENQTLLIGETNKILSRKIKGLSPALIETLEEAREYLQNRRLLRN